MRAKGFIYFVAAGVCTVAAVWSVLFSMNPTKSTVVNDLAENSGEKPTFEISSECGAAVIGESAGSPVREARNAVDAPSDPQFSSLDVQRGIDATNITDADIPGRDRQRPQEFDPQALNKVDTLARCAKITLTQL